jgi:RNA polymerase sigma-70 factor (ECF subfamily)
VAGNERELIALAKRGDVRAFEALIAAHRERVFQFALGCVKNPSEAEDLAQEALIKAFRGLASFREDASFSTWLFRIVKNAFLDDVKSRAGKEQAQTAPLDDVPDLPSGADTPERDALRRASADAVQAALAELPPDFRMVVTLFDVQGFSYDEISEVLAIPVGTVKSRLSRGREALRGLLFERRAALGSAWNIPAAASAEGGTR